MDVRVHGKNLKVDDELRGLAEEKLGHTGRIFGDDAVVDAEFTEQHNPRRADRRFKVEATTRVAGRLVRVEASAGDERAALDLVSDKLERRLRRLKERLIDRSRTTDHKGLNEGLVLSENEGVEDAMTITRVKSFAIKPMMPEEAALQMELLDHDFFFFLNGDSERYGVLYRRDDGSLGLIEAT